MAQPVATVTLGGTDITTYCAAPEGGTSLVYGRGANFDGSQESPGYCVVSVKNNDRRFDPYNAGSSLISVLKLGKKVRVTALYSATTYYLFDGYLTRIVSDPVTGFATLYAEDALGRYARREVSIESSYSRTLTDFRDDILDAVGELSGNRSLNTDAAETATPLTGADQESALSLLTDINRTSGSLHFVSPDAAAFNYTVVSRTTLQSAASSLTITDADLTTPFPTSLGGFDYTAEGIVNQIRVQALPRLVSTTEELLWELPEIVTAAPAETVEVWAEWDDPAFTQREEHVILGTGSVTVTYFRNSAKVAFTGGIVDDQLLELQIYGYAAPVANIQTVEEIDATSQTAYDVQREEIDSVFLESEAEARGLAKWYIFRYKDPQPRPPIVIENRFPAQLNTEIAARVTLTSTLLSLSARDFFVRALETRVSAHGAVWETEYQLEGAPAVLSLFTIGGTAAQGVGGTGILGY